MARGFELKLDGVDGLHKRLQNITEELKTGIKQEIQASGQTISTNARGRVPVDTGFLKNSISEIDLDNGMEVVAQKEYAAYVEFGTGALVDVPAGLEAYAIQFKGSGQRKVNLPARPFLFPAFFVEKPKLIARIKNKLNKA